MFRSDICNCVVLQSTIDTSILITSIIQIDAPAIQTTAGFGSLYFGVASFGYQFKHSASIHNSQIGTNHNLISNITNIVYLVSVLR